MTAQIRRGSARFVDRVAGRVTRHAFSFGEHYDADRLAFGPMVCHDDHLLGRGQGFETHRHSGLDIVTWVISGALVHTGSDGAPVRVPAGAAAHLHTGDGIEHSEFADDSGPARFVQVWLRAPEPGAPAYTVTEPTLVSGRVTPVLDVGAARFGVATLAAGDVVRLPDSELVHAFVATGALLRSSMAEPLSAGDAFALTGETGVEVTAAVPTQLLVWQLA